MKKKDAMKWAVLGGVAVFLILYGIEVATSGIGVVYGPIDGARQPAQISESWPAASSNDRAAEQTPQYEQTPRYGEAPRYEQAPQYEQERVRVPAAAASVPERSAIGGAVIGSPDYRPLPPQLSFGEGREPSVNRVAEQTAGLLQSLSNDGIRMVVSIFDSLTK